MNQRHEPKDQKTNHRNKIVWECRYFMPRIPDSFRKILAAFFPPNSQSFSDVARDVYLLKKNVASNVKLREPNFLKLKIQTAESMDGFEEWREVFKRRLPVPNGNWEVIARHFDMPSLEKLSELPTIAEVLNTIRSDFREIHIIKVDKERRFYHRGPAQVEIAEFYCGSKHFFSIQFESKELQDARKLHEQLSGRSLGQPQNYVSFLLNTISELWDL
ncbi:MAG: hypothetical protein JSW26_11320 [Desulfobacterales bacterium]|nr:MAG: hypothetical protein JSW26_11320 [Desulfobacterales bacterium]